MSDSLSPQTQALQAISHSSYGETLFKYELAEAISQGHKVLIIGNEENEIQRLISTLPFNLNRGGGRSLLSAQKNDQPTNEEKKNHLKIAWQYGKYIKG